MKELSLQMSDRTNLNVNMRVPTIQLNDSSNLSLNMQSAPANRDYNRMINKPKINGVELVGDRQLSDLHIVSENTTAGWNSMPDYIPKQGEICIYTDYEVIEEDGQIINVPGIKIGDGNAYVVDLPFASSSAKKIEDHISNTNIHVTQEDKEFWSNKLNCYISEENLIFNRS